MGEQQVLAIAVVFSQEKNDGWVKQDVKLGRVTGSWRKPAGTLNWACATEETRATASALRAAMVSTRSLTEVEDYLRASKCARR